MISIIFAGKLVMAMHIVTMEVTGNEVLISLSNQLVLKESFTNDEEKIAIVKKFKFLEGVVQ